MENSDSKQDGFDRLLGSMHGLPDVTSTKPTTEDQRRIGMKVGMFGNHPDPETDFCIEVDIIEGLYADYAAGLEDAQPIENRIAHAMDFPINVLTPDRCIRARDRLRVIRRELVSPGAGSYQMHRLTCPFLSGGLCSCEWIAVT
jgi:hypothetical protein